MAATDATLRAFFQSPKFAVVGASTNTAKYGYKGESIGTVHRHLLSLGFIISTCPHIT